MLFRSKTMEKNLNDYLDKVEKYLKPLPISERVDIVKEIKSEILELQSDGKTAEQITGRLGNPKELAKAYVGERGNYLCLAQKHTGNICLLRYPSPCSASSVLRTNKANWNTQTVRQKPVISEKAQKNRSRSAFSQSDLYLLSIAPSNAPSMTGRCSSGHIITLRLMRWRWSCSSPAASWLKYFAAGRLKI